MKCCGRQTCRQDVHPTCILFVILHTFEKSLTQWVFESFVYIMLGCCLLKYQLRKQSCDSLANCFFHSIWANALCTLPVCGQSGTGLLGLVDYLWVLDTLLYEEHSQCKNSGNCMLQFFVWFSYPFDINLNFWWSNDNWRGGINPFW